MQGFFSQTTAAIALKLHTLIGHHQMTLWDKSQNSISDFGSSFAFKAFSHKPQIDAFALKLHTLLGKIVVWSTGVRKPGNA